MSTVVTNCLGKARTDNVRTPSASCPGPGARDGLLAASSSDRLGARQPAVAGTVASIQLGRWGRRWGDVIGPT
jgi:hypothetical protein